jgi:two-component system sensor histidine kinase/response regulator
VTTDGLPGDAAVLRSTLRDMVAFSVLPALWSNAEPRELAESLLLVLQNTLRLSLVYLRMSGEHSGPSRELARTDRACSNAEVEHLSRAFTDLLASPANDVHVTSLGGELGTLRCLRVPIAWRGGQWALVAASSSESFPSVEQGILLRAAANYAAVSIERATAVRGLRESERRAEAANRDKDRFLANVSHEIRTPMNAILGMTDLTLDSPLSGQQREWLQAVKSAGQHLLQIIEGLLDFSKVGAHKLQLDLAEFSLRAELARAVRALAVRAHDKGLELLVEVHDAVPEHLIGDAGRLRQILINLLENAIKFTANGYVALSVTVTATTSVVELQFEVRDTGIGIPIHQHQLIFDAFAQADTSTTRRFGGTGLGLTIAAQLAALMGGAIRVISAPGEGSTFTLRACFMSVPSRTPAPGEPTWLGSRMLVVNPTALAAEQLKRWVEGWGMQLQVVSNGARATDRLMEAERNGSPSLLLMEPSGPGLGTDAGGSGRRGAAESHTFRLLRLVEAPAHVGGGGEVTIQKPLLKQELLGAVRELLTPVLPLPRENPEVSDGREPAPGRPLHVLVAEDNEFNAMLVQELLRRRRHRAQVVGDGREVLAALDADDYDVLLLDLHMPGLDGFQVVEAVRARELVRGGHLPVIALTARAREQDRERCLAAGMDAFLAKPLSSAALWAALASLAPVQR